MKDVLLGMIAKLPWWSFVLAAVGGVLFGVFQLWLWKRSFLGEHPKKWLFAVKMVLWVAVLVAGGCLSVPLAMVFAVCATIALLGGFYAAYKSAQKAP